jgi:non-ribosomal peptide synthetase component F
MNNQLSYWQKQLDGSVPLAFSNDIDRTDVTSFFTTRKILSLSGESFQSFKSLVRQLKSTSFVTLLSAFNVLLYHHLHQTDVRIATLAANRNRRDTEGIIGHFANTLIIRTLISPDLRFREFVKRVRDTSASAYSHQELPFDILLHELGNRSEGLSPLLFVFQGQFPSITLTDLTVTILDETLHTETPEIAVTAFDFVILMKEGTEGLKGFLIYKMVVLDDAMVEGFILNFNKLLERTALDPDQTISALCFSLQPSPNQLGSLEIFSR